MEEIKIRDELIHEALAGNLPVPTSINNLPIMRDYAVVEFCYLQFRMICHLIAFGCLVAHGDIVETQSKNAREAYEADRLIRMLSKLHPDFYPVPGMQVLNAHGRPRRNSSDRNRLSHEDRPTYALQ
jgi:hypothetical protein